ncbi:MAG: HDOD domain-containing protein [Desulfobacterales bacterium]|nr:HDOD domain-containing protein [Desulfobacterales bacterium]MDD4392101.1 HDOD domain-containing protein [Desulfobacterales bacterium]
MKKLKRYHIPAGSYYVGKKSSTLLQAYLGTCVGVALYDTRAGVGGLIHLLLPAPVSAASTFDSPEKYASTGLPLFLEALYEAGADRDHLTACIAGGALVGQVNEQDLALDIGGRTAEVVMQILEEEHIRIEASETGGGFTCCLGLNMHSLTPLIDPVIHDYPAPPRDISPPASNDIDRVIKTLQPIPQIALKVMRLINRNAYNIDEVAKEICKDQVISARILKFCNSVMFPTISRIRSLDEALVLMGQDFLVQSVLALSIKQLFNQCDMGYSLCKGGLFYHAIGTAAVAGKIAQATGKASPSVAYTAGLLHDIGKVVLDQYIVAAHPLFYRKLMEESDILDTEHHILGITHTEVGRRLADQWKFHESLKEAIYYHHNPEESGNDTILTHIVYLADLLMSRFNTGLELERIGIQHLSSRLEMIGLSISQLEETIDLIPRHALQPFSGSANKRTDF